MFNVGSDKSEIISVQGVTPTFRFSRLRRMITIL